MSKHNKKRIIIGISGASGAPIAISILKALRGFQEWESHLVITRGGMETIKQETKYSFEEVCELADIVCDNSNIGAPIASGTFHTEGMIVVPCSMKTLAGINTGYSDNLLLRAADVVLKERRRLVLAARETPFSAIHLRNMLELTQAGAIILPPMLSYYNKPTDIDDMTNHIAGKILGFFDVAIDGFRGWGEQND